MVAVRTLARSAAQRLSGSAAQRLVFTWLIFILSSCVQIDQKRLPFGKTPVLITLTTPHLLWHSSVYR